MNILGALISEVIGLLAREARARSSGRGSFNMAQRLPLRLTLLFSYTNWVPQVQKEFFNYTGIKPHVDPKKFRRENNEKPIPENENATLIDIEALKKVL